MSNGSTPSIVACVLSKLLEDNRLERAADRFARHAEGSGPTPPLHGSRIILRDLVRRPELNGQRGTVTGYNADSGRWIIDLDNGDKANVYGKDFDTDGGMVDVEAEREDEPAPEVWGEPHGPARTRSETSEAWGG